jgi:hypothetical protein
VPALISQPVMPPVAFGSVSRRVVSVWPQEGRLCSTTEKNISYRNNWNGEVTLVDLFKWIVSLTT